MQKENKKTMEKLNRKQIQILHHYLIRTLNYKAKFIIQEHCQYYGITIQQFNDWLKCYMKNYKDDKKKYINEIKMQNEAQNFDESKPRPMRRKKHKLQ